MQVLLTGEQVYHIIYPSYMKLSKKFAHEAVMEWDRDGEGSFAEFVGGYMYARWADYCEWN